MDVRKMKWTLLPEGVHNFKFRLKIPEGVPQQVPHKEVTVNSTKEVGGTIRPYSEQTVSYQLKIPDDVIFSIHNCEIISVEYYIKVYLDISFAFDPEVVLPLVIAPSRFAAIQPGEAEGPYPPGTTEATSYSNLAPPGFHTGLDPEPTEPGTVLPKGVHTFRFGLKIPEGSMPSSFKGVYGKIVYIFEAKMSRSWWWPSKVKKKINFISKTLQQFWEVMCPQSGTVSKNIGGLSQGRVQMSATIDRNVCTPGETISVVAKICNSSSKNTRPKFKLEQKTVFRCNESSKKRVMNLFKEVGETISPNSEQTVSCQLKIPDDAISTIHNCEIISVEYYIKVYLDISFAFDPEVVFPLVIVPSRYAAIQPGEAVRPYPPGTTEVTSYSNFAPPGFHTGFGSVPTESGHYPTPDATQHDNITSDNYNQWSHGATAQEISAPVFKAPSMQHPGPTLTTSLQGEQPPLYTSIYQHQNETL
ncbi:arrestin domain-containing protein 2 [Oreochromis niloticus]|uniref:arrestin domain-containing protein 2 n=1 Tax=Oreochromis niloticus TaxID=8128 RepID=UPI0009059E6C|nr:arrestin domain-containing protein 2 [Oreochromis niloticus]